MTEFRLSDETCGALLKHARESIAARLAGRIAKNDAAAAMTDEMRQPAAVFVTLRKNGSLRGCVGRTEPNCSLYEAVAEMARAAAFNDYRFQPVTSDELDELHIEISVLSPLRRVAGPDEIQPGLHGVRIRSGARSGFFLPQVWASLPAKEDFLGALCEHKAGLSRDAWRSGSVEFSVLTVFAFGE